MRDNKKFNVLDSSKAGIKFRSDKLESLNEQYSRKLSAYDVAQTDFKVEMMAIAGTFMVLTFTLFRFIYLLIAQIRYFFSFYSRLPLQF